MTFQTTRWSLVLRARGSDEAAQQALAELCANYWPPVYWLYRRRGVDAESARDLTQGLFAHLLARGDLQRGDQERGRFRAYVRTCALHWLQNERDRDHRDKRGGGAVPLSFDSGGEETRLALQPIDRCTPEAAFERRWAEAVLERALQRLERDEASARRGAQFAVLRPVLDGGPPPRPWADLAQDLGITEGALKVAAHRLKARFRDSLLAEVRDTLPDGIAPGEELQELLQSLAAPRESR